jgi:nucleoside-diphosphate-sugar epimerase
MKVLVISGSGWLGHNIVKGLVLEGHEVQLISRGRTERYHVPASVQRILGDRTQPHFDRIFRGLRPDVVMDVIPADVGVTRKILDAFAGQVSQYIHCSSTGGYAPLRRVPGREDDPYLAPEQFGAGFAMKRAVDELALQYHAEGRIPVTVIRPTNIIGAGMLPIDIWGARNVGFLQRVADELPITIPNDGRALLQPGHVEDVAEVFVRAVGAPEALGQVYIASCSYSLTLQEYVRVVADCLGAKPPIEFMGADEMIARYGDTGKLDVTGLRFLCEHMCFSIAKARAHLGYEPRMTAEDGIEDAVRWAVDTGRVRR